MKTKSTILYICTCLIVLLALPVQAKEVTTTYKDLTLNAHLELAEGKKINDGVVLMTHGGLAHRDMEAMVYLRELFKEKGYSTLSINLSLGLSNRKGMYQCKTTHRHLHEDIVGELSHWLGWLKSKGVKHVTLLGHSRGGGQTALYATEKNNKLVKAIVLMAPQTKLNGGAGYQQRYNQPLKPILDKANKLIKKGKGKAVIKNANMLFCRDVPVTAESFVSYYGPDPRLDSPYLLPKIKKPTLVLIAGDDGIVVGLEKVVTPIVNGKKLKMKIIEGSDHFFRDLFSDDAVDAIDQFLKSI